MLQLATAFQCKFMHLTIGEPHEKTTFLAFPSNTEHDYILPLAKYKRSSGLNKR